jgi:DNA-binding NtrC family response regulator
MKARPRRQSAVAKDPQYTRLVDALQRHRGNVSAVAREYGHSRIWIHRMIRKFGINTSQFRDPLLYGNREPNPELRSLRPFIAQHVRSTKRVKRQLRDARRQFERAYVEYMLEITGGNRREVSKRLGISLSSLKEKIRY